MCFFRASGMHEKNFLRVSGMLEKIFLHVSGMLEKKCIFSVCQVCLKRNVFLACVRHA